MIDQNRSGPAPERGLERDRTAAQIELHLPAHVRACLAGDWAVFLDLRANCYRAAPAARLAGRGGALRPGATFDVFATDVSLGAQLQAAGLACQGPPPAEESVRTPGSRAQLRWPATIDLALALVWARRIVREGALERMCAELHARRSVAKAANDAMSLAEAWVCFQARRAWFPAPYVCLFDSLALAMFAARRGLLAEIVFGVRARPFAAHCWVEQDGRVINDAPDYCAPFTPILRA